MFDITAASDLEQMKYLYWVKDKMKLYRAMFKQYCGQTGRGNTVDTFETTQKASNFISLSGLNQLLTDLKIARSQLGGQNILKQIVLQINTRLQMLQKSSNYLNLEGFIEFFLQIANQMFSFISDKPSKFVPLLFDYLREASLQSPKPLFQAQFNELKMQEDGQLNYNYQSDISKDYNQDAPSGQMSQKLRELTRQVNDNPNYVLPHGFKKVKADKIREAYEPDKRKYPKESQQIAVKIIDDLLGSKFDIHILEPVIKYDKQYIVKQSPQRGRKDSNSRAGLPKFGSNHNSGHRNALNDNILIQNINDQVSEVSDAMQLAVPLVPPPRAPQSKKVQMAQPLERNLNSGRSPSPRKNNYLQSYRYKPQKLNQASEFSEQSVGYGPGGSRGGAGGLLARETEGSVGPSRYEQMQRNRNILLTDADNNSEIAGTIGHNRPHY